MNSLKIIASFAVLACLAHPANAESVNYAHIDGNPNSAIDFGKYLTTEVSEVAGTGGQEVEFKFGWNEALMRKSVADGGIGDANVDAFKGFISDIYVMDGIFVGVDEATGFTLSKEVGAVEFSKSFGDELIPDAQQRKKLGFETSFNLKMKQGNGDGNALAVQVGETLTMTVDFRTAAAGSNAYGKTFEDVKKAIENWFEEEPGKWRRIRDDDYALRFGMHVQGLPSSTGDYSNASKSDKFLNDPTLIEPITDPVPEPGMLAIWGAGLAAAAMLRRRRLVAKS